MDKHPPDLPCTQQPKTVECLSLACRQTMEQHSQKKIKSTLSA